MTTLMRLGSNVGSSKLICKQPSSMFPDNEDPEDVELVVDLLIVESIGSANRRFRLEQSAAVTPLGVAVVATVNRLC